MIRFDAVRVGTYGPLSLSVPAGATGALIVPSAREKTLLLDLLCARHRPDEGAVHVLGHDLYVLPEAEATGLYGRIGVVPGVGGTISNLKVWENVILPLWYHEGTGPDAIESAAIGWYTRLGRDLAQAPGFLRTLAGSLAPGDQRLVCLIRALLMDPALMIYDALFEGLDTKTAALWSAVTAQFHSARPGRASLHVATDERSLSGVTPDLVIRLDATMSVY